MHAPPPCHAHPPPWMYPCHTHTPCHICPPAMHAPTATYAPPDMHAPPHPVDRILDTRLLKYYLAATSLRAVMKLIKWNSQNIDNVISDSIETMEVVVNKQKKIVFWRIYFYTSKLVLGLKFKIQMAENRCLTFRHLKNRHLTAQQTAPRWDTQKSKIG